MRALFIEPPLTEAEAEGRVTPEELATAEGFLLERRRREYLTWRAVVRRELGADIQIAYNRSEAPVIINSDAHIGISHCTDRVAVCISDRPCAIDIEPESRDFGRAMSRFISPAEQAISGDPLLPALVWCAKEVLYKYAGRPGLDLLHDLHVEAVDFGKGIVTGRIKDEEPLQLTFCRKDGFIVVYIL